MQDIRFSPLNPFTEWTEINRQTTDFRITILNVTIDDLKLVDNPFFAGIETMIERFERTYAHLKLEFPWFFSRLLWRVVLIYFSWIPFVIKCFKKDLADLRLNYVPLIALFKNLIVTFYRREVKWNKVKFACNLLVSLGKKEMNWGCVPFGESKNGFHVPFDREIWQM